MYPNAEQSEDAQQTSSDVSICTNGGATPHDSRHPATKRPWRCANRVRRPRAPRYKDRQLNDGSTVLLRPIDRSDATLLAEGFARLSPESRRSRFLTAKPELSAAELRYFTDVDHFHHEAIVALAASDGRGTGVARYIRDHADPRRAEVAVAVIDEWHRRGLGSALMAELTTRALASGIRQFTALVAVDNVAVIGLLRRMNADVELISVEQGAMEYDIVLRPAAAQPEPRSAAAKR